MNYLFLLITIFAGIYACTYGRWLGQNGNKKGAYGVLGLAILSLALSVYHLLAAE